jgi:fatty-acyl-CoA synthase
MEERVDQTNSAARPRLGWAEATTLGDMLLRSAGEYPDRTALVFSQARHSYAELAELSLRRAAQLIAVGAKPGDRIGMLLPNGLEALSTIFGVALAGCILAPINVRFRATELRHILFDGELAYVVTENPEDAYTDFPALLVEALPELAVAASPALHLAEAHALRGVLCVDSNPGAAWTGSADLARLGDGVGEDELRERRAGVAVRSPALILYTSGTTSVPRGCLLSHESLVRNWTTVGRRLKMSTADRCWNPLPLFHIGGIGVTILNFSHGATMITETHFDVETAMQTIAAERPTVLYPVFPPIMLALINHPRFGDLDLGEVRAMSTVGDPRLLTAVQEAIPGSSQVTTYGLTETTGVCTYHDVDDPLEVRLQTVGSPQPGVEVRVVDPETQEELGAGASGEIRVRGWSTFLGYHGNPERTASARDEDGWLLSGDRGFFDADGYLHFEGRLDEMIKVGGENVSPAEVEAFLGSHPAVHLAQVVGLPDDRLGEVAAAFVELIPGTCAEPQEIIEFCNGAIARFKIPRHVRVVDEWPMSATKVRKGDLREVLMAELGLGADAG